MIQSMGLSNFKAFKNSAYIDFKKLNIFLGPNSSGKSSYLKALLTLRNTMNAQELESAIQLTNYIGSYEDVVFGNNLDDGITFDIRLDNRGDLKRGFLMNLSKQYWAIMLLLNMHRKSFEDLEKVMRYFKEHIDRYIDNPIVRVVFTIKHILKTKNVIDVFEILFKNGDKCRICRTDNGYQIYYNECKIGQSTDLLITNKFLFKLNMEEILGLSKKESEMLLNVAIALSDIENSIQSFTKNMLHIEPLRDKPERVKQITDFKFNTVGPTGENTLSALIGLKTIEDEASEWKVNAQREINRWLEKFDLAQSVEIQEKGNSQYSLIIKNKFTGIPSNILDVGVGTSQLLPIIIESINSPSGSVLLIEEPETHIHPNAQAKLGELFVECAMSQEKMFFIETHSMYLVRQLQILTAKGEIKPEDIGIYYFEQTSEGTKIKDLRLLENGQFAEEIPKGFFDVPFNLSKQLLEYM